MSTPLRRGRRTAVVCAAIGVVLLVAAGGWLLARGNSTSSPHVAPVPIVNTGSVPATTTSHAPSTPAARATTHQPPPAEPMDPVGARLTIPRVDVDAPVVAVDAPNRALDVPLDPKVLGWWTGGAKPGSGGGSIVIDGHINYNGVAGALSVLPNLHVGDRVTLTRGARQVAYRISAVRTYAKDQGLPSDVFAQDVAERLVLITCGGPFDAGSGNYEDNIVAYAAPVTPT